MKIRELTKRQTEVLNYIQDYVIRCSYSPTIQEIGDHFQISATSAIHHVDSLEKKDKISRTPHIARSIVVSRFQVVKVPIFTFESYLMNEAQEIICIPEILIEGFDAFCLEMEDSRLLGAGITVDDIVIIGRTDVLDIGEFGVVQADNKLIVGQFFCEDEHIRLEPNNPMYGSVVLYPKEEDVKIVGKFLSLYRRF